MKIIVTNNTVRPVRCIETGIVYDSTTNAGKSTGIIARNITACCKGKRKTAGGYHWEYAEYEIFKCNKDCTNCPLPDCINDYVEPYIKERRKIYYEKQNERDKQLRIERKANGICTECGKKPIAKNSTSLCVDCFLKSKRRDEKRQRKNGVLPKYLLDGISLCKRCGKDKPVEGYKLCKNCLEKARQSITIGRSMRKNDTFGKSIDGFWKIKKLKNQNGEKK